MRRLGGAEQIGRGRRVFTSAVTQLPPPSAGSVLVPSSLMSSGDCSLLGIFLALRVPFTCIHLSQRLEPPPSAAGIPESLEVALLDSTQDRCMGIHLFLSPTHSQFYSCQASFGSPGHSRPPALLACPAHTALPWSFSLCLNRWVAPRLH